MTRAIFSRINADGYNEQRRITLTEETNYVLAIIARDNHIGKHQVPEFLISIVNGHKYNTALFLTDLTEYPTKDLPIEYLHSLPTELLSYEVCPINYPITVPMPEFFPCKLNIPLPIHLILKEIKQQERLFDYDSVLQWLIVKAMKATKPHKLYTGTLSFPHHSSKVQLHVFPSTRQKVFASVRNNGYKSVDDYISYLTENEAPPINDIVNKLTAIEEATGANTGSHLDLLLRKFAHLEDIGNNLYYYIKEDGHRAYMRYNPAKQQFEEDMFIKYLLVNYNIEMDTDLWNSINNTGMVLDYNGEHQ